MSDIDDTKKIGKLLEDIDVAMLTTVGARGFLVSRPLSTRQANFDGSRIRFFTEADSPKVAEIRRNAKVNLAYASEKRNTYVSLTGTATISRDRALIDALWNDAMKAFFPNGKDDPNLVVLDVALRSAEYWDGPSTAIGKLVTFVIARVTKNEEVMGENRIVDLGTGRRRLPPSHARARKGAKSAAKRVVAKAPAKKAVAKKAAAKKSATKKAATKKAAPRKAARKAARKSPRKTATRR